MPNHFIGLDSHRLNVIVAYTSKCRYIACNNDLPWKRNLRGDHWFLMKYIRIEQNTVIIMGRKTFESMPVIKNIENIVISRDPSYSSPNAKIFNSFEQAVEYAKDKKMFIIIFGGSQVYEQALKWPCKVYTTIVEEKELTGDTVFPEIKIDNKNISKEVDSFLSEYNINKTWVCRNNSFTENGFEYTFNLGYFN